MSPIQRPTILARLQGGGQALSPNQCSAFARIGGSTGVNPNSSAVAAAVAASKNQFNIN